MNYLAHAWLSFNDPSILAGNMISDFVKGKKQYDYSIPVQKGIKLHRAIDEFTDGHPATKEIKKLFRPAYGLYAGAFADVAYDYFLANDTNEFASANELIIFSDGTYQKLEKQITDLPAEFRQVFVYMKQYDWLSNYRFEWAISKSFAGLVRRARYMNEAETAFRIFLDNIETMRPFYNDFFPMLKNYSIQTLTELRNND